MKEISLDDIFLVRNTAMEMVAQRGFTIDTSIKCISKNLKQLQTNVISTVCLFKYHVISTLCDAYNLLGWWETLGENVENKTKLDV